MKPSPDLASLWEAYRADPSVERRNALIEAYVPFVRWIAVRLWERISHAVEVGDLFGAGILGLIQSFRAFDPDRGTAFSSYAQTRIRGAMLDYLREQDWSARRARILSRQLRNAEESLEAELGRRPTDDELAEKLGLASTEFAEVRATDAATTIHHLDALEPDERDGYLSRRAAPDERLARRDVWRSVSRGLSPKERLLLILYYMEGLTMEETGRSLGLTESRVSQLHSNLLKRLRSRYAGNPEELALRH